MNFRKYIVLIAGFLPIFLMAQQDPQFNQYFFNPLSINPAYAGSRGTLSAIALHRSQWVGFDGAPTSQAFAIHSPSKNKKNGIGFQIIRDEIGPKSTIAVSGVYAYKIKLGRGKLGFGLRASAFNYTFNWDEIEYRDNTSTLNVGKETYLIPSFDYGMYYSDRKNFVGFELTHLNEGRIGVQVDNINIDNTVQQQAQLIITAGRAFVFNRYVTLKPSILIRSVKNQPAFIDLNASILLKEKLWLGLSYRRGFGVVAIAEYNITRHLRFGYSFDISLTSLNRRNGGSHEIFLGYDLKLFKSRSISPRYF